MKCFVHGQGLIPNRHRLRQLLVGESRQRADQHVPSLVPFREELGSSASSSREFLFALSPGFLSVGGEEVGKPGFEISRDVPGDGGDRVSAVRGGSRELIIAQLIDGRFSERLIAKILGANRLIEIRHWMAAFCFASSVRKALSLSVT